MAESINSSDERVRALRPEGGAKWSLERLHLCQNPPCLPSIGFAFASDAISINAHHELERTAAILEKHPGLRLTILGMARPDAPHELGVALSQARAVRVRSHLLGLLANSTQWQDEDATEGVREGGYDEGEDIDDTLDFYSCQRWEYVQGMQEQRLALDVSVEIPAQLQDVFPPIDSFEDLQGMLPDYAFKGLSNMGIEVPTPIQAGP
eukprot:g16660.t1